MDQTKLVSSGDLCGVSVPCGLLQSVRAPARGLHTLGYIPTTLPAASLRLDPSHFFPLAPASLRHPLIIVSF